MLNKKKYNEIIDEKMNVNMPYSYLDKHKERFIFINNYINKLYGTNKQNIKILNYARGRTLLLKMIQKCSFMISSLIPSLRCCILVLAKK